MPSKPLVCPFMLAEIGRVRQNDRDNKHATCRSWALLVRHSRECRRKFVQKMAFAGLPDQELC